MAKDQRKGNVVVIQAGDREPEVHEGLSLDSCLELVGRHDDRMAERLKATEARLEAVRTEIAADPDLTVEYFLLQQAHSKAGDLLSCDLRDYPEEQHKARIDQYHRYSEVGSALLYRDKEFRGSSKFFTTTWPNFKWWPYKFNDAASSAKAWGGNILFEHTWYRGRRLYLVGLPYVQFPDLEVFGFNDIASSFASIP
jgi:hypothetical protein